MTDMGALSRAMRRRFGAELLRESTGRTFAGVDAGVVEDHFFDPQPVAARLEALPAGRHAVAVLRFNK